MKSPMVKEASYIKQADKKNYSDLQVLKSNCGYYIGTIYVDPETGFAEPGSRDSEYFKTEREAQIELELLEKNEGHLVLRMTP